MTADDGCPHDIRTMWRNLMLTWAAVMVLIVASHVIRIVQRVREREAKANVAPVTTAPLSSEVEAR